MGAFDAIDWEAVQAWYDAGHTLRECMERHGFSKRSWRRAVAAGLLSPRVPGTQVGPSSTRFKVQKGLESGKSYGQIATELGIAKSTVAFHARRLGREADKRFYRRYDWDEVQRAHDEGMSVRQCMAQFGFAHASWHQAVVRGAIKPRDHRIPLKELLVVGRNTSRTHLKGRLIAAGLKENRCERCGIIEWQGVHLNMQLHHKNGNGKDNRLENLEFLCANCHSLTDTWGGRNGHRKVAQSKARVHKPADRSATFRAR